MTDLDRRFFTELVYGVVRRRNYLDAVIEYLCGRKINKLSSLVVEILRLGSYQLLYMDKVPVSAAVNESVNLAKKMTRGLSGFVNGVLRNVVRRHEEVSIDQLSADETERKSFIYNQPVWLLREWEKTFGPDAAEKLCQYFNEQPRLIGRVNTLRTTLPELEARLEAEGTEFQRGSKIPGTLEILRHEGSLDQASWVQDGSFTFMDEASMAVAHVVDPQKGEKILDCCAAPGGKTMYMSALMNNEGEITAGDIHEHKISLMESGAERLGVTNATFIHQDGTALPAKFTDAFDRVLVDAPCSGLGILQKKLDMRWHRTPEQLTELPALQLRLLDAAARAVRPGGILVYSTCTLNREENEGVVRLFMKKNGQFQLEDSAKHLPFPAEGPMVTLLPFRDGTDGFFMARLRKENK